VHSLALPNIETNSLVELVHFSPAFSHFGGVGERSMCNFRAFRPFRRVHHHYVLTTTHPRTSPDIFYTWHHLSTLLTSFCAIVLLIVARCDSKMAHFSTIFAPSVLEITPNSACTPFPLVFFRLYACQGLVLRPLA
jgi:hypothetical protein